MTRIFDDPATFADDQLAGFCDLYADRLRAVAGGVVAHRSETPQVAVVIGGGSGHYPAFCGTVGPGLATGAVVGNIFTSPSAAQAYSVGRAADQGRGVIFSFGNYAGDTMNFGIAARRLRAEGIDARIVVVTDDIASADVEEERRGIAGDFTVFKVMGAAAAEGMDIDEVERVGRAANDATRTLGLAFSGCTMPGADEPLFSVPEGHIGLGLGIHGEPGISDVATPSAGELAQLLTDRVLAAAPEGAGSRVAAVLNGLGSTKYEELFLLWSHVSARLRAAGLEVVQPEVGELVTSLDMGGCSLTLMWLDEELARLWRADAYTPAYRKSAAPLRELFAPQAVSLAAEGESAGVAEVGDAAVRLVPLVRNVFEAMQTVLVEQETELGRIDAVAGDGDHGRGMVKGITAATSALAQEKDSVGGPRLIGLAGQAWAEKAGGTSGVLWGAALEAFGRALPDDAPSYSDSDVLDAVRQFASAITDLGQAQLGDKTLLDALLPFVEALDRELGLGVSLTQALASAVDVAEEAAQRTSELRPKVGRARPLAEKSIGTPDAGAISMALVLRAIADLARNLEGVS